MKLKEYLYVRKADAFGDLHILFWCQSITNIEKHLMFSYVFHVASGNISTCKNLMLSCRFRKHINMQTFHVLTHLCQPLRSTFAVRETQSLGQQMLNATVGINGLMCRIVACVVLVACVYVHIFVHIFVHIYVHIYVHNHLRNPQTDKLVG